MTVRVRWNGRQTTQWFKDLATNQVPFAIARALTWSALAVQGQTRADLRSHFEIRNERVGRGIQTIPARKGDWPHATSTVGSRDEFMLLQETGGTKVAQKGAKNVAVPTKASIRRRGSGGKIPKAQKPRQLIASGKAFTVRGKSNTLFVRTRSGIEPRFLFRPGARIKPRFHFGDTGERVVSMLYPKFYRSSLEQAIKAPKVAHVDHH